MLLVRWGCEKEERQVSAEHAEDTDGSPEKTNHVRGNSSLSEESETSKS